MFASSKLKIAGEKLVISSHHKQCNEVIFFILLCLGFCLRRFVVTLNGGDENKEKHSPRKYFLAAIMD